MPHVHTVAVDLGKSRCRLAIGAGDDRRVLSAAGSPGLATHGGVDAAADAILPLLARAGDVDVIGVGAAGAWSAPAQAVELAGRLAASSGAAVAVASDVVTAHAGALDGGAGTLLIAGTGAAALGVDADGARLVDGWGPELGDFGSGSWIGRAGVRAVLRHRDGLGAATSLTAAVAAHIAPAPDPVIWLAGDMPAPRLLATAAPLVLDAAAAGDEIAAGIAAEAVRLLVATAVAASDEPRIVVHGGLTGHAWFRSALIDALAAAGRTVVPAIGDAFDGAALLARRPDTPHERFVHRAE